MCLGTLACVRGCACVREWSNCGARAFGNFCEAEQPIVRTPCPATARGHVFHKECLRGWWARVVAVSWLPLCVSKDLR
eukprot:4627071-Amphidinium_carterae.1